MFLHSRASDNKAILCMEEMIVIWSQLTAEFGYTTKNPARLAADRLNDSWHRSKASRMS